MISQIDQIDAVVRLPIPQARQLEKVMSRAFINDPTFLYALPDETTRLEKLHWFFGMLIRYGTLYGEVYTTPAVHGGALWIHPENTTLTFGQVLRIGILRMPFSFGWMGFRRFLNLSNLMEKWHKECVAKEHWYLAGLGVEPTEQGKGYGGALLQPILTQADAEGLPCYLETLTERNLSFYRRHGFQVAASGKTPGGGPMVWAMIRQPRR